MNGRQALGCLIAGLAALTVGVVVAPDSAGAADSSLMVFTPSTTDTSPATRLAAEVGADSAGVYLDRDGHVNVLVTTMAAADKVREGRGIPRLVSRSAADLDRVKATLDASIRVPGTAWWADPVSDQVVVTVDGAISSAQLAEVETAVAKLGPAARLTRSAGALRLGMSGGDAITGTTADGQGARCSAGFNVQANGTGGPKYFLTAGHCTNLIHDWFTQVSQQFFAQTVASNWPGQDFGMAEYNPGTTVVHNGDVNLYNGSHQDMTSAGDVVVGQYVERTGSSTGFHDGHVTATNASICLINIVTGQCSPLLTGMIKSNICAAEGDSGGPLFAGSTAYGIFSTFLTNHPCGDPDATAYYQPVMPVLDAYHVHIY